MFLGFFFAFPMRQQLLTTVCASVSYHLAGWPLSAAFTPTFSMLHATDAHSHRHVCLVSKKWRTAHVGWSLAVGLPTAVGAPLLAACRHVCVYVCQSPEAC